MNDRTLHRQPRQCDQPALPTVPGRRHPPISVALLILSVATILSPKTPAQQASPSPSPQAATGTADPSPKKLEPFCVIPESYTMRPAVFVLIPGAHRVGFTVVRETSLGLEPYTRAELRSLGLSWNECLRKGGQAASRHLATLTPKLPRDGRKIILYAHFQSENPLTSSIFISPDFPKLFEDTLGKDLYIAIPDRFNVFVFPKQSDSVQKAAQKMDYLYKEALFPVSREVFELTKEGIRVIGKF